MSLYIRWPLRNFYTFDYLVDSYRNTIPNGLCVSGMEIHLKIGLCEEKPCLPWADCSWDASFF